MTSFKHEVTTQFFKEECAECSDLVVVPCRYIDDKASIECNKERCPKRIPIPKVLEAIKLIWEKCPNQRLAQLIYNLTQFNEIKERDPFYLTDEELIEKIYKSIKQKRL